MNFDIHVIMMHYYRGEYTISGDAPYDIGMINIINGPEVTEEQLTAWAAHYDKWSVLYNLKKKIQIDDEVLDQQYRRAVRLKDEKRKAEIEFESNQLDLKEKTIKILDNPLEDFNSRDNLDDMQYVVVENGIPVIKEPTFIDKLKNWFNK